MCSMVRIRSVSVEVWRRNCRVNCLIVFGVCRSRCQNRIGIEEMVVEQDRVVKKEVGLERRR